MKEVYEETASKVRVGSGGKVFWMARGVRQECPFIVSAKLFALLLTDLNERMEKRGRERWR